MLWTSEHPQTAILGIPRSEGGTPLRVIHQRGTPQRGTPQRGTALQNHRSPCSFERSKIDLDLLPPKLDLLPTKLDLLPSDLDLPLSDLDLLPLRRQDHQHTLRGCRSMKQ